MARFGPQKGFETPGTVKIAGDLSVAGVFTTGSTVVAGVITEDVLMAADKDFGMKAGAGNVDFSDSTGFLKTPQGKTTLIGDVDIASGMDINALGGATIFDLHLGGGIFKTTTGAVTIGPGAVGITGAITIAVNKGITLAGVSNGDFDFHLSIGFFKTPTGKTTLEGNVDIAANVDVVGLTGTGKMDLCLMSGIFKTPTGAVTIGPGAVGISGTVTMAADKNIEATAGTGEVDLHLMTGIFKSPAGANTLSGDVTITGAKTFTSGTGAVTLKGNVSIDATKKITMNGPVIVAQTPTVLDVTILDTDPDVVVVGAIGAAKTVTLPTLADNQGRIITIVQSGDPGAFLLKVDGEGAEHINGNLYYTNSDQYCILKVLAIPAEWVIIGSVGSWSGTAP